MNYYAFHIGDYAVHTRHLTVLEDIAYRRLLDLYYTRETPLPAEVNTVCRLLGMREYEAEVSAVLAEFFVKTDDGWTHARCDAEIAKANEAAARARANGKNGGRPKTQPEPTDNPAGFKSEPTGNPGKTKSQAPNPNPITQSQIPPKPPKGEPEGFAEWYAAYPRKDGRTPAAKAFAKVTAPLATLLAALAWQRRLPSWTKDGGQYIPLPATYLNNERWNDERPAQADETEWFATRSGVEGKARELGLRPWIEIEEQWPTFKQRVMQAVKDLDAPAVTFDQLQKMAAARQGAH